MGAAAIGGHDDAHARALLLRRSDADRGRSRGGRNRGDMVELTLLAAQLPPVGHRGSRRVGQCRIGDTGAAGALGLRARALCGRRRDHGRSAVAQQPMLLARPDRAQGRGRPRDTRWSPRGLAGPDSLPGAPVSPGAGGRVRPAVKTQQRRCPTVPCSGSARDSLVAESSSPQRCRYRPRVVGRRVARAVGHRHIARRRRRRRLGRTRAAGTARRARRRRSRRHAAVAREPCA